MIKMLNRKRSGQGMTEYIIMVGLIAVVCIGAISIVGKNVDSGFRNIANALHGGKPNKIKTQRAGSQTKRNMGNFYEGRDFIE